MTNGEMNIGLTTNLMSTLNEHLHGLNKTRNNTHGGKRPNSGRKKLTDTKTISFRVPKNKAKECSDYIRPLLKSYLTP